MFLKTLWLTLLLVIGIGSLKSQIVEPVKWKFESKAISDNEAELIFTAQIDKTWHLYSQFLPPTSFEMPLEFKFEKSKFYKLDGKVSEPKGKKIMDKEAGVEIKCFENKAVFKQKIKVLTKEPFVLKGNIDGQACQDGKCIRVLSDFSFSIAGAKGDVVANLDTLEETVVDSSKSIVDTSSVNTAQIQSEDKPVNKADSDTLWGFFILAFVLGLAAILTPCVFPMIPMTVSFFMKAGKKGKFQALLYGFSIIAIYVLFGTVLSVVFGEDFGNWISTHWIPNLLFFAIFIVFAAVFFGYFELQMPSWLINKSVANEDKGGFLGPIFMALTLVLVSFSCTGPIVGTIVIESVGGQIIKPIIGMLGFSLAFALPFTLFALFPSWLQKMPKSGGWLNTVKVFLGFIELAFALKFLNIPDQTYHWGILDREVYLSLWIVIFLLLGLYLIGKIRFPHDSETPYIKSFPRLMIAIASFSFAVYMIPGLWGAPLKTLAGWLPPMETQDFEIQRIVRENSDKKTVNLCEAPKYADVFKLPHGLQGYFDLEQGYRCSKEMKKPIFIDFTGEACTNCRQMENNVWSDPKVLNKLQNEFIIVALYVDDKVTQLPKEDWYVNVKGKEIKTLGDKNFDIMVNKFKQNAQPYYFIVDEVGNSLTTPHAFDLNPQHFLDFLDRGLKSYKEKQK